MNCPNCHTYNAEDARYCGRCGTTLEASGEVPRVRQDQPSSGPEGSQEPHLQADDPTSRLKPRSLGGLVRETLAVYRWNFWVMLWISLPANIPLFIAVFPSNPAVRSAVTLAGLFTGLLADAAAVYAVSRWYLGRRANAATCYLAALNTAMSLLLAAMIFFSGVLAGIILSFLGIGIPILVFVMVIWFCYVQAIMIEGKRPLESLRRSLELVHGTWWRVFGIGVAFALLLLLAAGAASLPGILLGLKHRLWGDLLATLGGVVVTPMAYIGATLVYFDLRVRKEGYTLETLATELGFSQDSPPQGPTTPQP
ncbi:MAG: zinc ribbon domain-containing protein [Dehalococcoidia bacterium]|nr:zinc ribbon domain-containing protein [Dehalococcoidia bacterium]